MGRFWNRDIRLSLFFVIGVILVCGLLFNLFFWVFRERIRKENNEAIAGILGAVMETYQDVPTEELIKVISEENDAKRTQKDEGLTLLSRYGIMTGNHFALNAVEREESVFILGGNLVIFLAMFLSFMGLTWMNGRWNQRISRMCALLGRICDGDYTLDIRDNREDDLSGLKNEIYKLTVLYREQAIQARAGKEALAESVANISHQLKTPLTSAVVLADNLLESRGMAEETRRRFLLEISRQLIGMKWLVVTLLKLSRMDAGMVEFARRKTALRDVVHKAEENLELSAEWKGIRFEECLDDCEIVGDEKWLTECVQNILKNALEHSPGGGKVEIELSENPIYTQLAIRDHGPGIPLEEQKHLFERFFTASNVENENIGIGLALSKEIMERHGGYISVESGEKGTVFLLRFLKE